MSAPAGWYPDPSSPGPRLRLWDGAAWTDQVRPAAPDTPTAGPRRPLGRILGWLAVALVVTQVVVPWLLGPALLWGVTAGVARSQEHNERPGGMYSPLDVDQGQAFRIDGLRYAAGWRVVPDGRGRLTITGLRATNVGTKEASAHLVVSLTSRDTGVAESVCSPPLLEPRATAPVTCTPGRASRSTWDRISVTSLD